MAGEPLSPPEHLSHHRPYASYAPVLRTTRTRTRRFAKSKETNPCRVLADCRVPAKKCTHVFSNFHCDVSSQNRALSNCPSTHTRSAPRMMNRPSFKFSAGLHFSNVQSGDKINTLTGLAEFQQTCRQKFY